MRKFPMLLRCFIIAWAIGLFAFVALFLERSILLEQLLLLLMPALYTMLIVMSAGFPPAVAYIIGILVACGFIALLAGLWRRRSWAKHAIIMVLFVGLAQATVFLYLVVGKASVVHHLLFMSSMLMSIATISYFLWGDVKGLFTVTTRE